MKKAGLLICACVLFSTGFAQTKNKKAVASITLGAYYFDGWTGKTFHLTQKLRDSFPERQPTWGWVTSTPEIIQKQIEVAHEAGIKFFDFCWYYNEKSITRDPKNQALNLYLKAPNKNKLDFCIMVANHSGYTLKKDHWKALSDYWISLFVDSSYVKCMGKPLITFYSTESLLTTFGDTVNVRNALNELKDMARMHGLKGVTVAICVDPKSNTDISRAKACGFDIFTGYNFHNTGYTGDKQIPIDSLIAKEDRFRDVFLNFSVPSIPVATLNWDQRPWSEVKKNIVNSPRYLGYSASSVLKSVRYLKSWTLKNSNYTTEENIAVLYAWNEYGEGAWLTPSVKLGNSLLKAVKKALK